MISCLRNKAPVEIRVAAKTLHVEGPEQQLWLSQMRPASWSDKEVLDHKGLLAQVCV